MQLLFYIFTQHTLFVLKEKWWNNVESKLKVNERYFHKEDAERESIEENILKRLILWENIISKMRKKRKITLKKNYTLALDINFSYNYI